MVQGMRYVIIRIADAAGPGGQAVSLLEGARSPHLGHLAQAGAAGSLRYRAGAEERDGLQRARGLLGLALEDSEASPALCYAAEAELELGPRDTAWCCDFVTQHNGQILDPTAGRIPTEESRQLLNAIQDRLGSETRRWAGGAHSHHVFVTREPALEGDGTPVASPAQLAGRSWQHELPKGAGGEALRRLVEQASTVLDGHPVNRVRVDLGENPANLMWLWGAASAGRATRTAGRTRRSGAIVATRFPLRGLAVCLGMDWVKGTERLTEPAIRRVQGSILRLLKHRELVYAQVEVVSADPVERLCAMERLDQLMLKPLTEALTAQGAWRLLVVIDARPEHAAQQDRPRDERIDVAFVAAGTGVPRHPVVRLSALQLAQSPLRFDRTAELSRWFTEPHG